MRIFLSIVALITILGGTVPTSAQGTDKPRSAVRGISYGAGVSAGERITLDAAMKAKSFGKSIRVTGTVTEVCKVKGCWMMLRDASSLVRVTFKDYGFFMPMDLVGKTVALEGVLSVETLTEAEARHYAEDAGKSKKEIAKIVGDKNEYSFEATGVVVL
ncbi:MAG TPA: DUF4920 domain-containing protein [Bacteroidetes bacterium]|nr:DUF4920 domain-containing protein [Bacteroidota bacterium]